MPLSGHQLFVVFELAEREYIPLAPPTKKLVLFLWDEPEHNPAPKVLFSEKALFSELVVAPDFSKPDFSKLAHLAD
jgi:hypothetical protein